MSKTRVYDVAKELGLDAKAIVAKALSLGVDVRNQMSTIEPEDVARVKRAFEKERLENVVEEKVRSGVVRRRTVGGAPVRPHAPAPAPAPAPVVKVQPEPEPEPEPEPAPEPVEAAPPEPVVLEVAPPPVSEATHAFTSPTPEPEVSAPEPPPPAPEPEPAHASTEPAPAPVPLAAAPTDGGGVAPATEAAAPISAPAVSISAPSVMAGVQHIETPRVRPAIRPLPASILPPSMKELKIIAPPPPKPPTPPPAPPRAPGDRVSATPPLPLERTSGTAADGSVPRRTELVRGRDASLDATRMRAADRLKQQRKKKAPPGKKLSKPEVTTPKAIKRKIRIEEQISLQTLASRMSLKATDVLMKLIAMGQTGIHINSTLDAETAMLLSAEFGYEVEDVALGDDQMLVESRPEGVGEDIQGRSPVITVMGHVDHGKTSLLDAIRHADVAAGEAGGITQHIGAYKVATSRGTLVFLDTPGHEAFTSMRARGAQVTDIVVLVVAADDGVMPQTIEAINHAKAAKVPIIVAMNKIDKPGAQPDRVMRELGDQSLIPEEWGGETMFIQVSAKTGQGVESLLERIALQAEVMELKADVAAAGSGTVIEAKLDRGRGPVANLLVQRGTVKAGDILVAGTAYGKIRAMLDDRGQPVTSAGPSTPVEVLGLSGVPNAGDRVDVVADLRKAQALAESRIKRVAKATGVADSGVSLEKIHEMMAAGELPELRLVVKADVQGSVEAVASALAKLSTEKVKVAVIHTGVGGITESDVNLAAASRAVIIGFNARPAGKAAQVAEQEHVDIKLYNVIYTAIDEVKKAMAGLLAPTLVEKKLGRAEVLQVFNIPKIGTIAGCRVQEGKVVRNAKARIVRDSVQIWDGKIASLRRIKEDVKEVASGFECGISLENYQDVKQGDLIEAYEVQEVAAAL